MGSKAERLYESRAVAVAEYQIEGPFVQHAALSL